MAPKKAKETRIWGTFFRRSGSRIWEKIKKKGPVKRSGFTTITALYLDFRRTRFMDSDGISAMRRELFYQEFMIHYLQEEQKKRWEELRRLEEKQKKWLDELKTMVYLN